VFLVFTTTPAFAQKNLDFERWGINYNATDEAKNWLNTSDASDYGAPKVVFKEVENPAAGLASVKLVTSYWKDGAEYELDTLPGALLQQANFTKRPSSFEFDYKAFPKLGDEVLVGVQLTTVINDSSIVIGEGFFSSSEIQENWTNQIVNIHYYANLKPKNINIVALSSANATILDGSLGYAKIGSELYVDNLRLSTEMDKPKELDYVVNVFPNPAKEHINVSSTNPTAQEIKIYSLTGKLVLKTTFTSKIKIDISTLSTGTYVYNVIDKNTNQVSVSNKFNIVK
jgi:hypothetical protein